jgi:hypothetical protein
VTSELFNTITVFVPSNLASDNLVDVDLTDIETKPVVKKVSVDDYRDVMKGALLAQWGKAFNEGTNFDLSLVLVVFYVPDGSGTDVFADYLTVDEFTIDYAPLTQAFDNLWFASFFKTIFFPRYQGDSPALAYNEVNMFDLSLALAQLCKDRPEMSMHLSFVRQVLPLATPDTNPCGLVSLTREQELEAATALNVVVAGVTNPRAKFYWGMLMFMEAANTWLVSHSEAVNLFPKIFGKWMEVKNATGTFIGNKMEKIRLSGNDIKPMGTPSWLNSEANENMPLAMAQILDAKNVSYMISIADGTMNDSIVLRSRTIIGTPVSAIMIPKWVDYYVSQFIAKMLASNGTLTNPILKNETTYKRIQEILLAHLQLFAGIGRLVDIRLNMPAYSELPESADEIVVTQGWSAVYVYDLEKVTITGAVVV